MKKFSVNLRENFVDLCEKFIFISHRDSQSIVLVLIYILISSSLQAQDQVRSIHFEQNQYYKQFGEQPGEFYDSINGFAGIRELSENTDCQLQKIVFGFHPYWAGSDYLNYQWNLLSDFCYFSYEVDPSTGDPVSIYDWLTDPAIDSAQAHGVRVHLCVTIFSGHTAFFGNPAARQNLIGNLIDLVQQRNADGVNMDIEAMPSSVSESVTLFMHELSVQLKDAIPGAYLSIDLPAVNWGDNFDVAVMSEDVDWFFVMGYDYYWNGSSQAGPVSPLYSLVSDYNYSIARTISAYEEAGILPSKFILGIPYYGRQWKTESNGIPSPTLANATTLTYSSVRNNGSIYNEENYIWENNSQSSCYIHFQNSNWYQCFIGLDRDLREKYDLVNYRGLAGAGIWALGYDDGYDDLWQALSDKFTDCYIPVAYDTICDSGGPTWNYYTGEDYLLIIDHGFNDTRHLTFSSFSLEQGFDSLWLYAGKDTTAPFLGGFTGQDDPGTFSSPNGAFTLRFRSDGLQNASGWQAVYHDGSLGTGGPGTKSSDVLRIWPNPAASFLNIDIPPGEKGVDISVFDNTGRLISQMVIPENDLKSAISFNVEGWPAGVYSVVIKSDMILEARRFIVSK